MKLWLALLLVGCAADDLGEPDAAVSSHAWSALTLAGAPPGRYWHALAAGDHRLFAMGGRDDQAARGDTWVLDLTSMTWREITASGPGPRWGHGASVGAGHLWVFGGQGDGGLKNDVWALDLDREIWSKREPAAGAPDIRYGFGAAEYDADRDRLVISHGFAAGGRHDDTWIFTDGVWSDVSPAGARPLKRCLHDTALAGGTFFLYGGCSSGFGPCPQGDLWSLDLAARSWTQLPAAGGPAPRQNASIVATGGKVIVLHGTAAADSDEVWAFDLAGGGWSRLAVTGPAARSKADAAVVDGRIYFHGGLAGGKASAELWALDL